MWALISIDGRNAGSAVQRIDIDVCDEHGQIAVALRGFSSRPVRAGRERPADQSLPAGLSLLAPQWVIADSPSMPPQALPTLAIGASNERRDWLAGLHPQIEFLPSQASTLDGISAQLSACAPFQRLIWLAPAEHSTLMLFRLIKALLQLGVAQQALHLQLIFTTSIALRPDEPLVPEQAACHGLAGSLAKEQEQWRVELIDLPAD